MWIPLIQGGGYGLNQKASSALNITALLAILTLSGCGSVLTEAASDAAGVVGAGAAASVTKNAATAAAIGLGTQSVALEGVHYLERRVHRAEQDAIATAAGPLVPGVVAPWSIRHILPIEDNEHGHLVVSRVLGNGIMLCKEIVFSVDTTKRQDFYVAMVCRSSGIWKWASAEPAVPRWGGLQ
jgi:uncharacterized protein YceK